MSLYHKYRPTSFDEMVGNFAPFKKLVEEKCPHAFLFTGFSGSGKTTAARILKTMLKCEDMDYHEYNTANTRGIDTIRAIIDTLNQTSFGGGPVIYVIDECHQLSSDAMNALLKPLEDAPNHVYFILCTSEPAKVIKAIQTRCTVVNFAPIPDDYLADLIEDVADAEKYDIIPKVTKKIVKAANGSARKALVILEQVISAPPDAIDKIIADNDNVDESAEVIELCRQVFTCRSNSSMNTILKKLKEQKEDAEKIRRAILGYGAALLLNAEDRNKNAIMENMEPFLRNTYDTGFSGLVYACNKATTRKVF